MSVSPTADSVQAPTWVRTNIQILKAGTTMSTYDLAQLTPIGIRGSELTHATTVVNPISTNVDTLCGRTVKVTSAFTQGTFEKHAQNTVVGYKGGACRQCLNAAGLAPRQPTAQAWA